MIDPTSGTLYVVAKTKEVVGRHDELRAEVARSRHHHRRREVWRSGGDSGKRAGDRNGASGGQVPFIALRENQRPGLLLSNGVVYFGFASHGDNPPVPWLGAGYNATTLQQVMIYNDTANGDDGGIWMNGDGLAADSTGNIYFMTGNGTFDANTGGIDLWRQLREDQPQRYGPGLLHALRSEHPGFQ